MFNLAIVAVKFSKPIVTFSPLQTGAFSNLIYTSKAKAEGDFRC